jgi:hypothetical protein
MLEIPELTEMARQFDAHQGEVKEFFGETDKTLKGVNARLGDIEQKMARRRGYGNGSSGSGSGAGSAAKPGERLYVPGQPVPGQVVNDPTPLGPGQDVPLTPYTQVVQAYQQAALDATNQSLIPGSERDLVRQYFSSLGESSP